LYRFGKAVAIEPHGCGDAADDGGMIRGRTISGYASTLRGTSPSDAEIVLPGRGLQYPGRIAWLSPEGCLIESKCRLEPGTTVELWMRTHGMPLRLTAHLVVRREAGIEFRFQELSLRKLDQIEDLRSELTAEAGAA
jgi:hypothetical protein